MKLSSFCKALQNHPLTTLHKNKMSKLTSKGEEETHPSILEGWLLFLTNVATGLSLRTEGLNYIALKHKKDKTHKKMAM